MAESTVSQFRRLFSTAPTLGEIDGVIEALRIPLAPHELAQMRMDFERVVYMHRYAAVLGRGGLVLGGGYVVNFLVLPEVGEPPRLTFDIDTATRRAVTKAEALKLVASLNQALIESGLAASLEVGGRRIYLGLIEHDVERDVLPFLLPLRIPVVSRWSGVPLWRFLAWRGVELRYRDVEEAKRAAVETLGVDEPKVDYLRVGVSMALEPPVAELRGLPVSDISWQLSLKLREKLLRPVAEGRVATEAHDMVKALLDLRAVDWYNLREDAECRAVEAAIRQTAQVAADFWQSHHYLLVRKRYSTPQDLALRVWKSLKQRLNC